MSQATQSGFPFAVSAPGHPHHPNCPDRIYGQRLKEKLRILQKISPLLDLAEDTVPMESACNKLDIPLLEPEHLMLTTPGEKLAKSTFTEVVRYGDLVVKTCRTMCSVKDVIKEAVILHELAGRQGIQRLVGVCPQTKQMVTCYEGRNLQSAIKEISPMKRMFVALEIVNTMMDVHRPRIIHNNLNPMNICINIDEGHIIPRVTIIDFGSACISKQEMKLMHKWRRGECNFAPELGRCWKEKRPCPLSDCFSICFMLSDDFFPDRYFELYPKIKGWITRCMEKAKWLRLDLAAGKEILEEALLDLSNRPEED